MTNETVQLWREWQWDNGRLRKELEEKTKREKELEEALRFYTDNNHVANTTDKQGNWHVKPNSYKKAKQALKEE